MSYKFEIDDCLKTLKYEQTSIVGYVLSRINCRVSNLSGQAKFEPDPITQLKSHNPTKSLIVAPSGRA